MNPFLTLLASDADSLNVVKSTAHGLVQRIQEDPAGLLSELGNQAIKFGLKVIAALLIYIIGAWLIRRVKKLLARVFVRKDTDKTITTFVTSLVSIILTILLVVIVVGTLGVNTTSLAALLAAGGMAIGMAMSGTVQNFAGGVMLLAFKPFKVGDYIKALGYEGVVTEVNIVSTKLLTFDNDTIVLPNGTLSSGNIDNFSHKPLHRCVWKVTVAYGNDPDTVRSVLLDMFKGDDRILDSTTEGAADPAVILSALKESTVEFTLRVWVKTPDYWPVINKYNEELYKNLPANGVSFAFPQLDVHVTQG